MDPRAQDPWAAWPDRRGDWADPRLQVDHPLGRRNSASLGAAFRDADRCGVAAAADGLGGLRWSLRSSVGSSPSRSSLRVQPSAPPELPEFDVRSESRSDARSATADSRAARDPDGCFRVVVRVRPPLERERASPAFQNVVKVCGDTQVCLHEVIPDGGAMDRGLADRGQLVNNHLFTFDQVFDQDALQTDVYASTARASVVSALEGYNATVLAYGPTGTGKTFTMEGGRTDDSLGIIPRSVADVFGYIQDRQGPHTSFRVRASYLQIYNEVISDLLKPERSHLAIRQDQRRGVYVEGLSEWLCRSPAEVEALMERGSAARATAHTTANDASSRSHAVFLVVLEQSEALLAEDQASGSQGDLELRRTRVGRLNLVDLAGSERPRLTGATGQRLEETKKINQSLSALGNVIATLTDRRGPRQHVPYRDSKLTRLLEDSLGGNCRTTMMAMVSPVAEAFSEAMSTLKFAHRAKAIRNTPQINEDVNQRALLRRYEAELQRLRAELHEQREGSVDLRHLQELEECARRAEADRNAAVSALQERGLELQHEVAQKQQLEECVRQLSREHPASAGGWPPVAASSGGLALLPPHLAQEWGPPPDSGGGPAEAERERSAVEDDKAQAGRYKQLLFKQRDIMTALTQRLHERDEAIIGLQDDIGARDRRIAELEAGLRLAEESQRRYPPEAPLTLPEAEARPAPPPRLLTAEEKIAEVAALLQAQRQENHCLQLEMEALRDSASLVERAGGVAGAAGAAAAASAAAAESAQAAGVDCPWAARESSPSRAPPGQGALSSSGSSVTSGSTARGGGPLGSDVSTDDGEQARPRLSEGAKRHLGKDGQASRTLAGAGQGTPGTPSRYDSAHGPAEGVPTPSRASAGRAASPGGASCSAALLGKAGAPAAPPSPREAATGPAPPGAAGWGTAGGPVRAVPMLGFSAAEPAWPKAPRGPPLQARLGAGAAGASEAAAAAREATPAAAVVAAAARAAAAARSPARGPPGAQVECLRAEAQRSVDALLRRRREELRRSGAA